MKHVTITIDGACWPNPGGSGGWAVLFRYKEIAKSIDGTESATTNNRMELTAAIQGLRALKESCAVRLRTDSMYVIYAIRRGRKAKRKLMKNADLVQQLWDEMERHVVEEVWVRGHAGDPDNEACDFAADRAARSGSAGGGLRRFPPTPPRPGLA